jgi:L-fuconolactonase
MSAKRIDAHQHFWKYNPIRDSWITEDMKVIQRDFLPEDLAPILKENKIDGTISVQADQSEEETNFLLELSKQHELIKGVVGWIDLRSSNLNERLEYYSQFDKLKGFRHVAQAEPIGFLRGEKFSKGISLLNNYNFTYDILIYHYQLKDAVWLANQHPEQKFIIDHIAKPNIKEEKFDEWANDMSEFASLDNTYCKLSGMVTEANWNNWKYDDFTPYLNHVMKVFGTQRLVYGSDWPVCLIAGKYNDQLSIVESYLSQLSESEKESIMGENAIRFYNI